VHPGLRPQTARIQAGDEVESSLVVLEVEFLMRTRTIFEIAMGELNSGTVCLDARVDHECTTKVLFAMPDGSALARKDMVFAMGSLKSVYGTDDPRKCPGKKIAKEIAEIIIKARITLKSIIVVSHTSSMDLDLLRELLESAGYFDILPPRQTASR
jgi:hypothetical protein